MRGTPLTGESGLVDATVAPPILTRRVILLFATSFGALTSFYLLLSVVPLYVATGGAGGVGAGLATGAMMAATVLTELAVPRLLARFGYRVVLAAGLILLGGPACALLAGSSLPLVLTVCLARGAGLAIVVVAGTALVAELVPAERRGEGLGLYGLAVGVPAAVGLPVGLWLAEYAGYATVFLAGAAVGLVGLAAVVGLPATTGPAPRRQGVLSGLASGGIARPTVIFAAITFAAGVLVTFLPLAASSTRVATVALLVQSCVTPLARWAAGGFGDRHGSGRLLVPATILAALGIAALVWVDSPLATIAGAALFGAGFGVAQNVTLALLFERVPSTQFGRMSALWNLAYDAGMGIGAIGFGLLVTPFGYPASFAVTAAILLAALIPAWLDSGRGHAVTATGSRGDPVAGE